MQAQLHTYPFSIWYPGEILFVWGSSPITAKSKLSHSVSRLLAQLSAGDEQSVAPLWERFYDKLVRFADRALGDAPRSIKDEDDIASSVFFSVVRAGQAGRLNNLEDRSSFLNLLAAMTRQKVIDYIRYNTAKKRGGGEVRTSSLSIADDALLGMLADDIAAPSIMASIRDSLDHVFQGLEKRGHGICRELAALKMQGYSNQEIAERMDCAPGSVKRKLELITSAWERENRKND